MKPELLLIDLDDTIYPPSIGLWPLFTERINTYMRDRVGIPEHQIAEKRERLFETYGTTMRGLQIEHGIDPHEYLEFVHGIDLSGLIHPDEKLTDLLSTLAQPKWIFTNASRKHAENVLGLMGLRAFFIGIIDVMDTAPWCKPQPEAFEIALRQVGGVDPRSCLFVDDRPTNLDTARQLGLGTCLVGSAGRNGHPHVEKLADLRQVLDL